MKKSYIYIFVFAISAIIMLPHSTHAQKPLTVVWANGRLQII